MYLLSHGAVKVGRVVYSDELIDGFCRRRGEEHSFILKPASSMWKGLKTYGEKSKSSSLQLPSKTFNRKGSASTVNQYAIMVSCRCNYTGMYISLSLHYQLANFVLITCSNYEHINMLNLESRLFFKQPTCWRPRISRDLKISVASEMSGQYSGSNERVTQLPVQV